MGFSAAALIACSITLGGLLPLSDQVVFAGLIITSITIAVMAVGIPLLFVLSRPGATDDHRQ
jgi:hypothetical protein